MSSLSLSNNENAKKNLRLFSIDISSGYDTNMILNLNRKVTNKLTTHEQTDAQSNIKT
jgi:hypothetical protein